MILRLALVASVAGAAAALASPASAELSFSTFSFSGGNAVHMLVNGTTDLTATNTGWFTDAGNHDGSNPNYIAGVCGSDDFCNGDNVIRNDYLVFDVSSLTGPITSATIEILQNPLPNAGYISLSPSITYTNYDVSTSLPNLFATYDTSSGIYGGLGSGVVFAQTTVFATSNGTVIDINLNAAGLAALNSSEGGSFALGGSVDQAVANAGGVPEPSAWALMLVGFGGLGAMVRRRRTHALA